MSKARYDWWSYVKGMIRRYPQLCQEYEALHTTAVTTACMGLPRAAGDGRGLERAAIRELPTNRQREYEAVRRAIAYTQQQDNGQERLKIIRLVLWQGTRNLEGAAMEVPCAGITAKRWHGEFILTVAKFYGLLD